MPASSSCPLFLSTHTWQSVLEPSGSQGAHALNSDGTEHSVLEPPFVLHALSDLGQLTGPVRLQLSILCGWLSHLDIRYSPKGKDRELG